MPGPRDDIGFNKVAIISRSGVLRGIGFFHWGTTRDKTGVPQAKLGVSCRFMSSSGNDELASRERSRWGAKPTTRNYRETEGDEHLA
jgi:hypothetical protein